ncbi:MAG TPA: type II toxin-antitoxin system death-on-curing family toxin [Longimicrobium sp.]|jgi:death-on-curing protein
MAAEPVWLSRELVDQIHANQIEEHGGSHGARDDGLIESALERPRNRWQYDPEADLHSLAAAYGYGLAKNHGYIDGNKRVAYMAMYVFLGLNGLEIEVAEPETVMAMLEVAAGERSEDQLVEWLREHTIPFE